MTSKSSGLGDNFYIGGYDLSGDVNSIGQLGGGPALLDVTAINQFANSRIGGLRSADWQFVSIFDAAAAVSSPGFPTTGSPVVSTYANPVLVNITGGTVTNVTINGSTVGTGDGTYKLPAFGTITVTFTGTPAWTWTKIGAEHDALSSLPTADVIASYFRGAALQNPAAGIVAKQLNMDPTRDNTGNLTVAVELQSNAFGMEWGEQLTAGVRTDTAATTGPVIDDGAATNFGAQAYIQCLGIIGTSVTIAINHATSSNGTYSALMTSNAFTGVGAQRLSVSNTTTVNEFLEVVSSGTFTYAAFAVAFMRNLTAGKVF